MVEIHFLKNLQTLKKYVRKGKKPKQEKRKKERNTGADLGGGCRGCAPPPPEMTCGFQIQLVF